MISLPVVLKNICLFLYIYYGGLYEGVTAMLNVRRRRKKKKEFEMKPWIMSCMQFCFSLPSFESVSNPVHSLFSYHIIVFLIHGEKKKEIYIYSIRPIRCFLSLTYFFMYRSICNTV